MQNKICWFCSTPRLTEAAACNEGGWSNVYCFWRTHTHTHQHTVCVQVLFDIFSVQWDIEIRRVGTDSTPRARVPSLCGHSVSQRGVTLCRIHQDLVQSWNATQIYNVHIYVSQIDISMACNQCGHTQSSCGQCRWHGRTFQCTVWTTHGQLCNMGQRITS